MGGFLTIGYFSGTMGYCFLEIFVGGQGLDGGGQSPSTRENPESMYIGYSRS